MATKFNGKAFGETLLAAVKDYFARGIAPLSHKLESTDALLVDLERRVSELEQHAKQ